METTIMGYIGYILGLYGMICYCEVTGIWSSRLRAACIATELCELFIDRGLSGAQRCSENKKQAGHPYKYGNP